MREDDDDFGDEGYVGLALEANVADVLHGGR